MTNYHCADTDYPTSIECSVGGWYYYNSSINASQEDTTLKIECIRKYRKDVTVQSKRNVIIVGSFFNFPLFELSLFIEDTTTESGPTVSTEAPGKYHSLLVAKIIYDTSNKYNIYTHMYTDIREFIFSIIELNRQQVLI